MEELFNKYIIWELALIIVLSSYWLKNFFNQVLPNVDFKFKILIWSIILSVVYYLVLKSKGDQLDWIKFLFTYFTATSFYELAWKPLENYINNKVT